MDAATGIAGSARPELPAIFLCESSAGPEFFTETARGPGRRMGGPGRLSWTQRRVRVWHRVRSAPLPAYHVVCPVDHDAMKSGRECAPAVEAVDSSDGSFEGVLRDIVRNDAQSPVTPWASRHAPVLWREKNSATASREPVRVREGGQVGYPNRSWFRGISGPVGRLCPESAQPSR